MEIYTRCIQGAYNLDLYGTEKWKFTQDGLANSIKARVDGKKTVNDYHFDSNIEESSDYIFQVKMLYVKIYQSNNPKEPNLTKYNVKVNGWEGFSVDAKYYVSQIPAIGDTIVDVGEGLVWVIILKEMEIIKICLQREPKTDKIRISSKCIKKF
ncbi:hypothetical protein BCR36DRAFT_366650 [Piromyces finnis]|uniref:Uncharacterized protein n=1 Tax=Piromyces finnis TaxID=1754191 RepID=A0A1Y1VKL9_9FUNG|nr:hypothetical protein BCR36DRAFT_366650 [Piromyces finnis]|eukprot:ORX58436.1 hypothetical protein BCR36DRAFT_366650 [Piromyces finnis]